MRCVAERRAGNNSSGGQAHRERDGDGHRWDANNFLIDWVPGVGSIITVKGKVQGEPFKEPEFFKALMAIWLGATPADFKLKDALLGIK